MGQHVSWKQQLESFFWDPCVCAREAPPSASHGDTLHKERSADAQGIAELNQARRHVTRFCWRGVPYRRVAVAFFNWSLNPNIEARTGANEGAGEGCGVEVGYLGLGKVVVVGRPW